MNYDNEKEYWECQRRIEIQEKKDRKITAMMLVELFSDKVDTLTIVNHPKECNIDLSMSFTRNEHDTTYDFEIKERNKDINKYPTAELKQKKLNEMLAASKPNNPLYYVVLLNGKEAYIYNVRQIQWDSLQTVNWNIKKRQMEDGCTLQSELTYIIPISLASYRMNVEHIYKRINQTE